MTTRANTALYVLAGLVFTVSVAAVTVLELSGKSTATVTNLVGPVLGGLFTVGILGGKLAETYAKVTKVEEQTNGQLDARFAKHATTAAEAAATTALEKAGVTQTPPTT